MKAVTQGNHRVACEVRKSSLEGCSPGWERGGAALRQRTFRSSGSNDPKRKEEKRKWVKFLLHSEPVPAPCRWAPGRKWEDEREEERQMAGEAQFILHFLNV